MRTLHRKFLLLSFLLSMVFSLSVPALAAPETETETQAQSESETEAPAPVVSVGAIRTENGKKVLYDKATGKTVTGKAGRIEFPSGSGTYYYLKNTAGEVYVKTWIKVDGKVLRAQKDGTLASGLTTIGKKLYYFSPKTNVRGTAGWKTLSGTKYYTSKNGVVQTGFTKIGKYTYYLDPENNGARTVGWKTIKKKVYYFNAKGRMRTGLIAIDGFKYYFNANGVRKTGLRVINGSRYYFDKDKNGAMATGWITHKTRKYYFAPSTGKAVTGWLTLNSKKYYFSSTGIMQKGWLTQGDKKYYLSTKDGHMFTGKHKIDGKSYDFGTDGALVITGDYSIKVNQGTCVVTIYKGTTPVKAFLCSPGLNGKTPNGSWKLGVKRQWHQLFGGVWGQYTSLITENILFHSVYYTRYKDNNSLATAQYNLLGQPASAGCVRLNCEGAYYIYTYCPVGTPVTIFSGTAADDPLPRPAKLTITTSYDPTDPITTD